MCLRIDTTQSPIGSHAPPPMCRHPHPPHLRAVPHSRQLHKLFHAGLPCKQFPPLAHRLPGVLPPPQDADRDAWWHGRQLLLGQGAARVGDEVQEHIHSTRLQQAGMCVCRGGGERGGA